jgi:hypothetical protein
MSAADVPHVDHRFDFPLAFSPLQPAEAGYCRAGINRFFKRNVQ